MSRLPVPLAALCLTLLALFSGCAAGEEKYRILIMPKLVGIDYYSVVKQGVDQAVRELPQVRVSWSGPTQDQVEKQIEMIEKAIPTRPDLIAVAANDPVAIAPVLRKARAAGIRVISWDGDSNFREFFVNLVSFDDFAAQVVKALKEQAGTRGEIAIITTSFTAPNQASWIAAIKRRLYAEAPGLKIVDTRAAGESTEEAYRIAQDYLVSYPALKGMIVLGVPNLPGAARAVRDAGRAGQLALVGNSTPNLMRGFLKDGTVRSVLLWNAPDHGYLTVYAAYHLLAGNIAPGRKFAAGHLGELQPQADGQNLQVALPVMVFSRDNVDRFHF